MPQTSYYVFKKPVIYTNLITCSTKLSLHAAERCRKVLQHWDYGGVFILIPLYNSMKSVIILN